MIAGIGADIVAVSRIEKIVNRYEDRLAMRILAESEMEAYSNSKVKVSFLAKRFAAKEAAAKALGTGFRNEVVKRDIVVEHDDLGKPLLIYSGKAKLLCEKKGIIASSLSLSDEQDYALAFVVLEC